MPFATCTVCSSDQNVRECGRCHAAAYCSKECQEKDWHLHKFLCKSFTEFLQTKPLVPEGSNILKYVLGILYPEKENKPRLQWVPIRWISATEDAAGFELLYEQESYFGKGFISRYPIQTNMRTSHPLRSTLELHFRDNFLKDGSVSNLALATTTKGQHGHDWRGPLLVTGIVGLELSGTSRDMDLQDFRHITDYFLSYGSRLRAPAPTKTDTNISSSKPATTVPASTTSNQQLFSEKMRTLSGQSAEKLLAKDMEKLTIKATDTAKMKIEGVKIEATEISGGAASYTPVTLGPDHEIFRPLNAQVSRSEIAERISLPLLILSYPVTADSLSPANCAATWLHINTDDKSSGYGFAPMEWQGDIGPILIVREDKVRLTPKQMEIVCSFCQNRMGPLIEHSLGGWYPEEPKSRKYVLSAMTREKFEQFFIGYRTAKGWSDYSDQYDCRNPYTGLEL